MIAWVTVRCPICQRDLEWEHNLWPPFCSQRCQLTDLGSWAAEGDRVPMSERTAESESTAATD
ncbi:MAG: DNA gyrase inhibitor YacG [Nitrospirota bacterium]|nr:DNA gyrase inhibitor YacG [Nitrospirota bacterium]